VAGVRVTEFWLRMREQFGSAHADVIAHDQVLGPFGGRTALEALADGIEPRAVWLAVCDQLDVPVRQRH
jgi:hypothetical protein